MIPCIVRFDKQFTRSESVHLRCKFKWGKDVRRDEMRHELNRVASHHALHAHTHARTIMISWGIFSLYFDFSKRQPDHVIPLHWFSSLSSFVPTCLELNVESFLFR